jgi:hypothetical protein
MNWYYLKDNETCGPKTTDEIKELLASGSLTPSSRAACEGMGDWEELQSLKAFKSCVPPAQWISELESNVMPQPAPRPHKFSGRSPVGVSVFLIAVVIAGFGVKLISQKAAKASSPLATGQETLHAAEPVARPTTPASGMLAITNSVDVAKDIPARVNDTEFGEVKRERPSGFLASYESLSDLRSFRDVMNGMGILTKPSGAVQLRDISQLAEKANGYMPYQVIGRLLLGFPWGLQDDVGFVLATPAEASMDSAYPVTIQASRSEYGNTVVIFSVDTNIIRVRVSGNISESAGGEANKRRGWEARQISMHLEDAVVGYSQFEPWFKKALISLASGQETVMDSREFNGKYFFLAISSANATFTDRAGIRYAVDICQKNLGVYYTKRGLHPAANRY